MLHCHLVPARATQLPPHVIAEKSDANQWQGCPHLKHIKQNKPDARLTMVAFR